MFKAVSSVQGMIAFVVLIGKTCFFFTQLCFTFCSNETSLQVKTPRYENINHSYAWPRQNFSLQYKANKWWE